MSKKLWRLPGPQRWIGQISADLRAGRNVVIALPAHSASGLLEAVRAQESSDDDYLVWRRLHIGQHSVGHNPIDYLYEVFAPEVDSAALRSIEALCDLDGFKEHCIWLEDIPDEAWPAWSDFLLAYADTCAKIPEFERTLFCVALHGAQALHAPSATDYLRHHIFYNVMRELDTHFFISERLLETAYSILEERIIRAIIVNLALWDLDLAQRLIALPMATLLRPQEALTAFAVERDWEPEMHQPAWHLGSKMQIAGVVRVHSAVLTGKAGQQEIMRRIWRAQASVLLPFIEEQRQSIIDALHQHLTVPFETEYGQVINNLYDLEIGHIYAQIRNNYRLPQDLREKVDLLRDMRNSLSHLKIIPAELLHRYRQLDSVPEESTQVLD